MTVDFHFQSASIVKYRTDVTFGWLDLMVSFGGIAGLFLGCSILSGVEIIYYMSLLALMAGQKLKAKCDRFLLANSRQMRVNNDAKANRKKIKSRSDGVRVIKIKSLSDFDGNLKPNLRIKHRTRY